MSHLQLVQVRCRERKKGTLLLEQKFDKFSKFGKILSLDISFFQIEKKIVAKIPAKSVVQNTSLGLISFLILYIAHNSVIHTQAIIVK